MPTRSAEGSRHGDDPPSRLGNVITIDEERIKSHLDRVVRGSVEETLNTLLDVEADRLYAQRYERREARRDNRAVTTNGRGRPRPAMVKLRMPKLRAQTFEAAIIEHYRQREKKSLHRKCRRRSSSVEKVPLGWVLEN
jgi:putative transposase